MKSLPQRLSALTRSSFFKGSSIYLLGSVLNSALPLVIIPILTRQLTPTDWGLVSTGAVITQILAVFIGLNAFGLMARNHFDGDPAALRRLLSTAAIFSTLMSLALFAVLLVGGGMVERYAEFPSQWLPVVIAISLGTVLQNTYLALLQARGEPLRYIVLQTVAATGNLLLSLLFVVHWQMDWRGRMWALLVIQVIVTAFALHGLIFRLKLLGPIFERPALRELLAFGIPLFPHALGGWVMNMSARLYLNNMASVADTGLYSVAFSLMSPLAMIVGAANNAYVPWLFERLNRPDDDKVRLCRMLLLLVMAMPLLAFLAAIGLRWVLPLVVGERFYGAMIYLPWMALSYAAVGIYYIFGNFVVYSKRTSLMTWRADFLGGIVLLVTCPILIRMNGAVGAAQATCLAFCASMLGCITAARKAHPMPWGQALASLLARKRGPAEIRQ